MAMETRQVSNFIDTLGLFENDYDMEYFKWQLEATKRYPYDLEKLLEYVTQVRNSFGFDVDDRCIPSWLKMWLKRRGIFSFTPLQLSLPDDRAYAQTAANVAIHEINVGMTDFELVEVAKAVACKPYKLMFLTLIVKKIDDDEEEAVTITIQAIVCRRESEERRDEEPWELHQWRVKPDAAEA